LASDTGSMVPGHEIISSPTLVAGRTALVDREVPRTDAAFLSRVPLRKSGLLQSDGSHHRLGHAVYRNRRFAPATGNGQPRPQTRIEGLSIFGGVVGMHFGHVLTQSLGRLWAQEIAPDAPILFIPETQRVTELPGYLVELARVLGVANPLHLIEQSVVCDNLLVPQDICNLAYRPPATKFFREWLARRRPPTRVELKGRIYVSRSKLSSYHGHYLQERSIEEALTANGYDVFHPQEHSIMRQTEVLSTAKHLIFADGSAAHLWSLVAQKGQEVAVILRRPRDREFARWFRTLDCGPLNYLDFGIADFWRRGEGSGRSVALLDLQMVWNRLRVLGFHDDSRSIGVARANIEDWLSPVSGRSKYQVPIPFDLDQFSRELLSLRRHIAMRPSEASSS
jgi:Glycosyltransferase 61